MRAMAKKKPQQRSNTIAQNKRARHDYHLTDKFEAGVMLEGWEVKSLRAGKAEIVDTYVLIKGGEAFLLGSQITPLPTASTHIDPDSTRTRKLLLNKRELARIHSATEAKGMTCVCTSLYWKKHLVKAELSLATGKQQHDKRDVERDRDWNRQKQRVVRDNTKQ
ncbi:MAG: SsrA-binding protein [Halieaceae bacterium]|jgi:SsrA-binding protein